MKQEISEFKKDLKRCHDVNLKLIELNEKLIEVETNLFTVQATTFEEKTGVPNAYRTPKLHELHAYEDLTREIYVLRMHFVKVSHILENLSEDIRNSLIEQYMYKLSLQDVAQARGLARKTLDDRINRELHLFFKKSAKI